MDAPWEKKWKLLRPLSGGGQGDTFIVERIDGSPERAVLKRLKPAKSHDLKARARMHREVTSLSTLASEGARVPRVYDGNTGDFEKVDVPLFFIMEHIAGRTLDTVIKDSGVFDLSGSIALCIDLCRTLRISIAAGIAHRDIKPENLMLRESSVTEVVMLDFGLSFNKDEGSTWTEIEESLDNKFVSLPERRGPFENKRDFRSDLTSVAAVLFYVLTGFPPRNLRNSEGKTPNRSQGVSFVKVADQRRLAHLHAFFDRGLNNDIQTRFQTLDELESRLSELNQASGGITRPDFHAEAKHRIEMLFRVDKVNRYTRYREALKPFDSALDKHMSELAQRMEGFYVGWSSESDRHNQAEMRSVVWFFELKVFVRGRRRYWRVVYQIKEEAAECVLSRVIEKQRPDDSFRVVRRETVLFRYLPPATPLFEVMTPDIETSILEAMDGFNKEIENPSPEERPVSPEEQANMFREMRLALGGSDAPAQGTTTAIAEDLGTDVQVDAEKSTPPSSWEYWVENIQISAVVSSKTAAKKAANAFVKTCRSIGLNIQHSYEGSDWGDAARTKVISSGIELTISDPNDVGDIESSEEATPKIERRKPLKDLRCGFELSPELFAQSAQLIDAWREKLRSKVVLDVIVNFVKGVELEEVPYKLTTKIFGSKVTFDEDGSFQALGLKFNLADKSNNSERRLLSCQCAGQLRNMPLRELVGILFQRRVLWLEPERKRQRIR